MSARRMPRESRSSLMSYAKSKPGVTALRLARLAVSADVDQDQSKALRQIGHQGYPVARTVGVAVDQHDGRPGGTPRVDIGQRLAVRQHRLFLHRIEGVQIDLQRRRPRGGRVARGPGAHGPRAHGPEQGDGERHPPAPHRLPRTMLRGANRMSHAASLTETRAALYKLRSIIDLASPTGLHRLVSITRGE